jgi:hypothetical protein
MNKHPGIRIDRIPVEGLGGFIFTTGVLAILLVGIPALRVFTLICLAGGAIGTVLLYLWHKYR